ncbi:MAG TPA: hypothetical protein VK747_00220 [Blastocatellia bacterium]|nr:hypothetical protein [Blastocatellia bacterium]
MRAGVAGARSSYCLIRCAYVIPLDSKYGLVIESASDLSGDVFVGDRAPVELY